VLPAPSRARLEKAFHHQSGRRAQVEVVAGDPLEQRLGEKDVWLRPLPDPYADAPAIGLSGTSLEFVSTSGDPAPDTVDVSNVGTGTLDNVTVSLDPAGASSWLTVTGGGTGNAQTLANSINTSGLTNGVYQATVTVEATNASNSPAYTVTFTLGSQLSAPSNLTHTVPYSGTEISLSWQDNSDGETGFIIERADNGGQYAEAGRVGANTTAYTDTGLGAGRYVYHVTAYDGSGQFAPSDTVVETLTGNPRFAVYSPAPGDSVVVGDTVHVLWTSEVATVVEIMLSVDGGEGWTTPNQTGGVSVSDADWGDFILMAPSQPTTAAVIRVQYYGVSEIRAESGPFTTVSSAGLHGRADAPRRASSWSVRLLRDGAAVVSGGEEPVTLELFTLRGERAALLHGPSGRRLVLREGVPCALLNGPLLVRLTLADGTCLRMKELGGGLR
jgi:hypothetical protein